MNRAEKLAWFRTVQTKADRPPNTRSAFRKSVRDEWLAKQPEDLWCGICGRYIDRSLAKPHPMALTVDHIRPLSRGGTNDCGNLQPAHDICNYEKGSLTMKQVRRAERRGRNARHR